MPSQRIYYSNYINNCIKICVDLQSIKNGSASLLSEILGDTVRVYQQNLWEIKLDVQTGTLESWKVI